MKRITLAAMAMFAITATAQQLPNNGFDGAWSACTPYVGEGVSSTTIGITPESWNISHVAGMKLGSLYLGGTTVGDSICPGYNNSTYAVQLTNTPNPFMSTQIVPAYITLGTTWSTSVMVNNKDGGTFGGLDFTYRPDAIKFQYQHTPDSVYNMPSTVVAYLWSGTYEQDSVPVNIVMSGTRTTETMVDRDRNILGIETSQGGTITSTGTLIAAIDNDEGSKTYDIYGSTEDWTELTIPFTYYDSTTIPEKINVVFAASDYFNSDTIASGATLTVDDVQLVYYHDLTALSYNGTSIALSGGSIHLGQGESFDASLLSYTTNSVAATVESSLDEETNVLTITVKGNDYEVNSESYTIYTVTVLPYVEGTLSSLIVDETEVFEEGTTAYSVEGTYAEGCITYSGDYNEATFAYDEESTTATITVTGTENTNTYTVTFFTYDATLTSLIVNSTEILTESVTEYTVEGTYSEGCITCSGNNKEVTIAYNEETRVATIIVTGTEGTTTYTITFSTTVSSINNASTIAASSTEVNVYSLSGVLVRSNVDKASALDGLPAGTYIVDGVKQIKE